MPSSQPTLRVVEDRVRPTEDDIAPFREAATGPVYDAAPGTVALDYRIRALAPEMRLCAPALTVRTRPGDNIALYHALEVVRPGEALVIATDGHGAWRGWPTARCSRRRSARDSPNWGGRRREGPVRG